MLLLNHSNDNSGFVIFVISIIGDTSSTLVAAGVEPSFHAKVPGVRPLDWAPYPGAPVNFQKAEAPALEELFVQQEGKAPLLKLSRKGAVVVQA